MKLVINILLLIFTFISLNACSAASSVEDENLLMAINKLNDAAKICEQQRSLVPPPSNATLKKMNNVENKKLISYIKYRWHLNFEFCLIENGAVPTDYFVAIAYDEDISMKTKSTAKEFLKLRSNSNFIDSVNKILYFSEDELIILKNINYLDKDFDLLTVSESLSNYRETEK
ncbi:hypothetical protein ACTXMK_09925 [Psychrobacter celer]|uniref:hypothetical protein n=1 Tax=Psychrobacter celer TaxID=306572 RepID=UPI003FD2CD83